MKNLHLKYKSDNGTTAFRTVDVYNYDGLLMETIEVPCDSYLEWIEELAHKYLESEKKKKSDAVEMPELQAKIDTMESEFQELYSLIDALDMDSPDPDDLDTIKDLAFNIKYAF
jgi:uncharacterized protein YgbK (DUF1537 family)